MFRSPPCIRCLVTSPIYHPPSIFIPSSIPFSIQFHYRVQPIDCITFCFLCSLAPGNTFTVRARPDTAIPFGLRWYQFVHVPIDHLMYELDTLQVSIFFHADAIDIILHTTAGIEVITQPYHNPRRWIANYGDHVHTPIHHRAL